MGKDKFPKASVPEKRKGGKPPREGAEQDITDVPKKRRGWLFLHEKRS